MSVHHVHRFLRSTIGTYLILGLLVVVAGLFRLHALDTIPYGGLVDEVSIGYNAWSIAQTGMDEHGESYPLTFRAFGDQKLPGYIYLVAPFTQLFGPTNFAVRLPSAILGVLLVPIGFGLLRSLGFGRGVALVGTGIVAVSHWGFILSRFGFESHLGLFFWMMFLWMATKAWSSGRLIYAVSAGIMLVGTWYSYVAYRLTSVLFVGLIILGWALLSTARRKIVRVDTAKIRLVGVMLLSFFIGILPILPSSMGSSGTARFSQIGILSEAGIVAYIDEQRAYCSPLFTRPICYAVWNKPVVMTHSVIKRSLSLFSPQYLFTQGDQFLAYLGPEQFGQFSLFLLPILYLGMAWPFFARSSRERRLGFLALLIAIAGVLPMALAGEPQKVRATPVFPALLVWFGLGVQWFLAENSAIRSRVLLGLLLLGSAWGALAFQLNWFGLHTFKHDVSYNSQARELFEFLAAQPNEYRFVMDPVLADAPIYYSFYSKLDPRVHQETLKLGELEASGFQHPVGVERFELSKHQYTGEGQLCTMYITDRDLQLPEQLVREIRTTNGVHPVYFVYALPFNCPRE